MSASNFQFLPNEQIQEAKYEFVKILYNTPKNPEDYHALQHTLRYKLIEAIRELFGNIRITQQTPVTTSFQNGKEYAVVNGIWYLDGYRVQCNNLYSLNNLEPLTRYNIYIGLKFKEITALEDPNIAITDPVTSKKIITSSRIILDKKILAINPDDTQPDPPEDGYYYYNLGILDENRNFVDDLSIKINYIKYGEAVDRAYKALYYNNEGIAEIKRCTTDLTANRGRFVLEQLGLTYARFTFLNENDTPIFLLESVKQNEIWHTTLTINHPYATNHKVVIDYDKIQLQTLVNITQITPNYITLNTPTFNFQVDNNWLSYSTAASMLQINKYGIYFSLSDTNDYHEAFVVNVKPLNSSTIIKSLSIDDSNNVTIETTNPSNSALYEKACILKTGTNKTDAQYSVSIESQENPSDKQATIYARITPINLSSNQEVTVKCTVYTTINNNTFISDEQLFIFNRQYAITSHKISIAHPNEQEIFENINKTIRIKYEIIHTTQDNINILVELRKQNSSSSIGNIVYNIENNYTSYVQLNALRFGNYLIGVDNNGQIKLKRIQNINNIHSEIVTLLNAAILPGTSLDNSGGISLTLPKHLLSSLSFAFSDNINIPQYSFNNHQLTLPVFKLNNNDSSQKYGLLSENLVTYITNTIANLSNKITDITYPYGPGNKFRVLYVSPSWFGNTVNGIHFTKIQDAINHANNVLMSGESAGALIIVYPGVYKETLDLSSASAVQSSIISIIALEPQITWIENNDADLETAVILDKNKSIYAYIDIPIKNGSTTYPSTKSVIKTTNPNTVILFGKNAKITSITAPTIEDFSIEQGHIKFYGNEITVGNPQLLTISNNTTHFSIGAYLNSVNKKAYIEFKDATINFYGNKYSIFEIKNGILNIKDSLLVDLFIPSNSTKRYVPELPILFYKNTTGLTDTNITTEITHSYINISNSEISLTNTYLFKGPGLNLNCKNCTIERNIDAWGYISNSVLYLIYPGFDESQINLLAYTAIGDNLYSDINISNSQIYDIINLTQYPNSSANNISYILFNIGLGANVKLDGSYIYVKDIPSNIELLPPQKRAITYPKYQAVNGVLEISGDISFYNSIVKRAYAQAFHTGMYLNYGATNNLSNHQSTIAYNLYISSSEINVSAQNNKTQYVKLNTDII